MSGPSLTQIEQLFQSAVELPREQRCAWLAERCGDDQMLRDMVEALLKQHENKTNPLLRNVAQSGGPVEIPQSARVGPYRLMKVLGEGGCGTVYLARQDEPIRRDVALKVIKPGMDTRQVIARFEAERHTLALMDHPNVARVLDAGETDFGRPYFVMEYVPGTTITAYCDAKRFDTTRRLHLFIQVCEAVQHAHQKGVIHRDIKPSNVLVEEIDAKAIPKVIDFGVAKAMGERSACGTLHAEQGQLLGTPAYMSPEQADPSIDDIDTRSDVYSLGVLLYELLTGAYPFGDTILNTPRFDELREMILMIEPPKPSTRIRGLGPDSALVARSRGVDPRSLIKRLRGDLDWITLKAMEKDRVRRYAAVQELIADVTRHLSHEPVQARAPSRLYLARKFVRRNRAAVTAAMLVTLALIGGLIGTAFGMSRARRSELAARRSELAAQRQAYKANIAAAYAGAQSQDGSLVWRSLGAAPESHRGWEWHFLSRLAGGNGLTRRLPTGTFDVGAASSDGKLIATAQKSRVSIWDRATGALVATAQLTDDVVRRIAISPDHELMLAGGLKQTTMFSLKTGTPLWTRTDGVGFRGEQFTSDQSIVLLATSHEPSLLLVNPRDGSIIRNYPVQGGSAQAPLATSDRRRIVFADGNGWIVVIDAGSGEECWRHRGEWFHLTRDSTQVAMSEPAADRWTVRDIETGQEAFSLSLGSLPGSPIQGPDGRFALVSGNRLLPFDRLRMPLAPLMCPATIMLVSVIQESNELLAICTDGTLWKWDWAMSTSPFHVVTYLAGAGGASIASDGRVVATLGWGLVSLWDTQTGAQRWTRFLTRGNLSVSVNHDGSTIATAADDGRMYLLNGHDGRTESVLNVSKAPMTCLEWSPSGKEVLIGGRDGCVYRLRAVAGAEPELICRVGNGMIQRLVVHPNKQVIAAGCAHNSIALIDLRTGAVSGEIRGADHATVSPMAFSPDGEALYTCGSGSDPTRWDIRAGRPVATYRGAPGELVALCVHPDGTRIAAASYDTILVWDSVSAEELLTLEGPTAPRTLQFSSDGKTLLASGGDAALVAYETEPPSCGFAPRARAVRIRQIADAVQTGNVSEDAIELLEADTTLSPDERAEAMELVRTRGDPPNTLNSLAWGIARDARRSEDDYRRAVCYVRAALNTWPADHGFLNTLGVLQYRLAEYEAALTTLTQSDAACRKVRGEPHPADTAALAMVHHRLGDANAAAAALRLARDLMRDPKYAADNDNQILLHETEALIERRIP